jgi:hypothetical protein
MFMVTMLPRPRPASAPPITWRFVETLWPSLPAPCGLDADAARLLRSRLTLAVEQALEQWRKQGAPLPPSCSVHEVRRWRFDPAGVDEQPRYALQLSLREEARQLFGLVVRPLGKGALGGERSQEWAALVAQQCRRIGVLYQAVERQVGWQAAFSDLALALDACARG